MRFYVLIAVLLAALFGFLVYQLFSRQVPNIPGETAPALFAGEDIASGSILSEEMLEIKEVPRQFLPDRYLSIREQAIGQVALYPLVKGELILPEKMAGNQGGALAQRCPAGKWCISIPAAWFIATPPDIAEGDLVEIASALPGNDFSEAGYVATRVQVIGLSSTGENPTYILAVDELEALNILYARVNAFQLLILLRPTGG